MFNITLFGNYIHDLQCEVNRYWFYLFELKILISVLTMNTYIYKQIA